MRQRKTVKSSLFYRVLAGAAVCLLLIFLYVRFGMLRPWLTRYEASQPKHACQEIFQSLFAPAEGAADWGKIYDLAKLEGTAYQGREGFIRSMERLTADQSLTYVETSAGLSGDRRYLVKAGADTIAAFTLVNEGTGDQAVWRLDTVEMLLGRTSSATIRAAYGHRVLADGEELEESCQIQTIETAAERYLPEGVHGRRLTVWQTPNGLSQPELSVVDASGAPVELTYNPELGRFEEAETLPELDEARRSLALSMAETYAKFMIREASASQLQRYFDSSSQIYATIRTSETWMQRNYGYSFADEAVDQYREYGDGIFSVRVCLTLNVKREDGSIKLYTVDSALFFREKNGSPVVFEMTNVDVGAEVVRSRLVFMNGEEEAGRLFVSSEDRSFKAPIAAAPAGRKFAGWAVREAAGGSVTMTIRFQPEEDGTVHLPEEYVPEPMTLYAVFEDG